MDSRIRPALSLLERRITRSSVGARIFRAVFLQLLVLGFGTFGFHFGTHQEYDLLTCLYITFITLTTVGFGEIIPVQGNPQLMIFTIVLIILGMGSVTYFVGTVTSFVLDGELRIFIQKHRMQAKIDRLSNHYIVAGLGLTGKYVLPDLAASGDPIVVIDQDIEHVEGQLLAFRIDAPWICGDATDDEVLRSAGIERAKAVIFSLGSDRDNLFAVVTARRINPKITIVTRGEDPRAEAKLLAAGASQVVYTNVLGGQRMATYAVQPHVADFLEVLRPVNNRGMHLEGITVERGDYAAGRSLIALNLRALFDVVMLATRRADEEFSFTSAPSEPLGEDTELILLGYDKKLKRERVFLRTGM